MRVDWRSSAILGCQGQEIGRRGRKWRHAEIGVGDCLRLGCQHGLVLASWTGASGERGIGVTTTRGARQTDRVPVRQRSDADGGDGPQADVGNGCRACIRAARVRGGRRCRVSAKHWPSLVIFADPDSLAGLLYVRLLHGPISVAFLTQPIERAIAEEIAGVRRRHRGRRPAPGRRRPDRVRAQERARHRCRRRGRWSIAPSASVSLSRKALLSGRIAPESVDLISPRLSLFYSEDGTLALKFAPPAEPAGSERAKLAGPARLGRGAGCASCRPGEADGALGRIDLVKMLSESSARARRREHASAYLREIGLKSATVVIDHGGRKSIWRVPELGIDLDHRAAAARSPAGPRSSRSPAPGPSTSAPTSIEAANTLQLAVSVQGLVPRGLARTLPPAGGPGKPRRAGVGRCPARPFQHRRDPERHHRHRRRAGAGVAAVAGGDAAAHRRRPSGAVLQPRRAPVRRSRPRCWCGATAACSSPAASRTRRRAPRAPGWAFDLQVGRRLDRRRAAASAAADDRRLVGARVRLAGARPRRAQPVPAAGRRRGGLRRGRRDGHGRGHAGAPRRQDRADAGEHLQDALARAAGAAHPRLGGQASGARLAAGRLVPAGHGRGRRAGSGWAATTAPERAR